MMNILILFSFLISFKISSYIAPKLLFSQTDYFQNNYYDWNPRFYMFKLWHCQACVFFWTLMTITSPLVFLSYLTLVELFFYNLSIYLFYKSNQNSVD